MNGVPAEFDELLAFVHTHLDEDLSLAVLSARMRLSATPFHKSFRAAFGLTPRDYVERLRLERAALRLLVQDESVLQVALDHGFSSHETFTRAFRRRFELSPRMFRARRRAMAMQRNRRNIDASGVPSLSATTLRRLAPTLYAAIRHVGRYEDVPLAAFADLACWADALDLPAPRVWMGIGHDAPGVTPAAELRFDAALAVTEPFASKGGIACRRFEGGLFAVTTHAGPFTTLPAAYAEILPRVLALPGHDFVGLPAVEIYQTSTVFTDRALNVTDICLPVRPK